MFGGIDLYSAEGRAITRSELLRTISVDNPGLPLCAVEAAVSCFFAEIEKRLLKGGRVGIRGFGTFLQLAHAMNAWAATRALASRRRFPPNALFTSGQVEH